MTIKTENWLGEYTSTIGIGDIILGGAIDGFADFSNVGENVDVYYTVMDALDKETGIGTLTGGKLVRKDIHATLVAGVYVKNGTAINLSGDAQVYGTANAHFLDYVQAVANAEIVNTQAIAELKALQINGHALTASFNLTAADVGAHPDSWMPSTDALNVYQKDASDIRYIKTQDAEQVAGLVMRVGGPREQQLQQSIDDVSTAFIGDAPPAGAPVGKRWFDTESGRTYIKYNDGDSTQWVEESPQAQSVVDGSKRVLGIADQSSGAWAHRNKLINGDFSVWQRGTILDTTVAIDQYLPDRWKVTTNAGATVGLTAYPLRMLGKGSTEIYVTGKSPTCSFALQQRLEDTMCWGLRGKKATISFVAKSSSPISLTANLHSAANYNDWVSAPTLVATQVFNITLTPTKFTLTTTALDLNKSAFGLQLALSAIVGSSTLQIAEVQLEAGDVDTPYEYKPATIELSLCQRYYHQMPLRQPFIKQLSWNTSMYKFPVRMLKPPSIADVVAQTTYGDVAGLTKIANEDFFFYATGNGILGAIDAQLSFTAEL